MVVAAVVAVVVVVVVLPMITSSVTLTRTSDTLVGIRNESVGSLTRSLMGT